MSDKNVSNIPHLTPRQNLRASNKKTMKPFNWFTRLYKKLKFILLFAIGMLALRYFVPAVSESLKEVYAFIDTVILPILNWPFGIVNNVIGWLMNLGWFKAIISAIGALAA